jgi:prepilin peptidase CpaA
MGMPAAAEVLRWSIIFLLSVILVIASVSDIRHRRIPNWSVLAIGALFVPWAFFASSVSIFSSLGAALIALGVGVALYAFRIVGAGDSKLLAVVALFAGMDHLLQLLVLIALVGGVIALISLVARPTRAMVMLHMRGKGDFGRGIPYGVAIAIATICIVALPLPKDLPI